MERLSQCDVMKLRPHPGTTILFCAIKENPRRKICRTLFQAMRPRPAARGGDWLHEVMGSKTVAVVSSQHEKKALISGPYVNAAAMRCRECVMSGTNEEGRNATNPLGEIFGNARGRLRGYSLTSPST
jgi:hypothetical protein